MPAKHPFPLHSARALEYEPDLDKLSTAIDLHLREIANEKNRRAAQWLTNVSLLLGNHSDRWRVGRGGSISNERVVLPPRHRELLSPKVIENRILSVVQTNVSELTGMNPTPKVSPASLSPDDIDLARLGEIILRVLYERPLRAPEKLRQIVLYAACCGTAAAEVYFGELDSLEERIKKARMKLPDILTGGEEEALVDTDETEWTYRNGLILNSWSAFHIDVNPDATDDTDSLTWVCRSTYEDLTLLRRKFDRDEEGYCPENLEHIVSGIEKNTPLWHWESLKHLLDADEDTFTEGKADLPNAVLCRVIDTKPNQDFPLGRTIVQVGGRVVYHGVGRACTERYRQRWHPYSFAKWFRVPGRWEGSALVTHLQNPQRRITMIDALLRLNRSHLAIGAFLIPKSAKVAEGFFSPIPGFNLTYSGNVPPTRVPFQSLPGDVYQERALAVQAIDRIAGVVSSSAMGAAPSSIRANSMLEFIKRESQQSRSAMLLEFESFVNELAESILIESSVNLAEDPELRKRVAVAARGESDLAVDRFMSLDLGSNTSVSIDIREQILSSPEGRRDMALQYMQASAGNLTEVERARIAQILGLTEIEMQTSAQASRARRMVERVLSGDLAAAVVLRGIDNPRIFAETLRDTLVSERVVTAPLPVKEALQALLDDYDEQLAAMMPPPVMPGSDTSSQKPAAAA